MIKSIPIEVLYTIYKQNNILKSVFNIGYYQMERGVNES